MVCTLNPSQTSTHMILRLELTVHCSVLHMYNVHCTCNVQVSRESVTGRATYTSEYKVVILTAYPSCCRCLVPYPPSGCSLNLFTVVRVISFSGLFISLKTLVEGAIVVLGVLVPGDCITVHGKQTFVQTFAQGRLAFQAEVVPAKVSVRKTVQFSTLFVS